MLQSHSPPPALGDQDNVAELHSVSKIYYKPDGSVLVEALQGVDMSIKRGQYTTIMGPSGSGKSTLMNILGCLDRPTDGRFLLNGVDVTTMNDESLSHFRGRTIGFVFQAYNLISQLTIEENVEAPLLYQGVHKHERRRRAIETLELVGIGDRVGHRPAELSGGQQQRVAIARALVGKPVILMADEPTGNLDSVTGESVLTMIDNLHADGMTIIMVTHDISIADRGQRLVCLRDGLIESDTLNQQPR